MGKQASDRKSPLVETKDATEASAWQTAGFGPSQRCGPCSLSEGAPAGRVCGCGPWPRSSTISVPAEDRDYRRHRNPAPPTSSRAQGRGQVHLRQEQAERGQAVVVTDRDGRVGASYTCAGCSAAGWFGARHGERTARTRGSRCPARSGSVLRGGDQTVSVLPDLGRRRTGREWLQGRVGTVTGGSIQE